MKNLLTWCFVAAAFTSLVTDGFAQDRGGRRGQDKQQLERQVKRQARQVEQKLSRDADLLSMRELRESKRLLFELKQVLGLPTRGGGGGNNGGGGSYGPTCEVKYEQSGYNFYYYVYRDGQKFSGAYAKFSDAAAKKNQFVQSNACQDVKYSKSSVCSVKYQKSGYNYYYYAYVGDKKFSGAYAKATDAAKMVETFANAKSCFLPNNYELEPCSVDYQRSGYNNYYYVVQNGQRVSGAYSQFDDADKFFQTLIDSYVCAR